MMAKTNVDLIFKGACDGGKAWKFEDEYGVHKVLPDSQIAFDYSAEIGTEVDVEMPEWLAINEGLV